MSKEIYDRIEAIKSGLGIATFIAPLFSRVNPLDMKVFDNDQKNEVVSKVRALCGGDISRELGEYLNHGYNDKDLELIHDLMDLDIAGMLHRQENMGQYPVGEWYSSAGGPASGKSTFMLQNVSERFNIQTTADDWEEPTLRSLVRKIENEGLCFVSADRDSLVSIAEVLDQSPDNPAFYLKWRAATNILSNCKMAAAMATQATIVHDTTLSSPIALKNIQYAMDTCDYIGASIMVVAMPDDVVQMSLDQRIASGFYQALPGNIVAQREGFNNNLPAIRAFIDSREDHEISFAWRDHHAGTASPAANYTHGRFWVASQDMIRKMTGVLPNLAVFSAPGSSPTVSPSSAPRPRG